MSGSLVDGVLSIQSSAAKDLISLTSSQSTYTVGGTGMQAASFPRAGVTAIKIGDAGAVNLPGQTVILGGSFAITDPISVTGIESTVLNINIAVNQDSGEVVFGGPVQLPADKIRSVTNPAGNVRFLSTINGSGYLQLGSDGIVDLAGSVGNVSPLRGLSFRWAEVVVGRSPVVIDGRWGSSEHDGLRIGQRVGGLLLDGAGSSVTRSSNGITIEPNDADDRVGFFSGRTIRNFRLTQNYAGVRFVIPPTSSPSFIDEPVFRNWTLADNKITGNTTDGIVFEADYLGRSVASTITISGNTISLNKKDGIRVNGTPEDLLIQKNTLTGNGTLTGDAAIRFTDGLGQPRLNVTVDGNAIGFFNPLAPKVAIGTGIQARNLPGLRITGNTLTNLTRGVSLAGDFSRADASPVLAANVFSRNAQSIRLESATNVTIDATNAVNASRSTGLSATGDCAGSTVTGVAFQNAKVFAPALAPAGISLTKASGIRLSGVSVAGGGYGIQLKDSKDVVITSPSLTDCRYDAIFGSGDCSGSTITAPTLSQTQLAINLAAAGGLKIQDGTITNASRGLKLAGLCAGTQISGFTISGTSSLINLESAQGATLSDIAASSGGLSAVGVCTGTTVTGLSTSGGASYGASISGQGLRLENSSFKGFAGGGLWAHGNCAGTVVTATSFDDNVNPQNEGALVYGIKIGSGIGLPGVQGLTLANCTASGNQSGGLIVSGDSTGTAVTGSTINGNGGDGIVISGAAGLTLSGNSVSGNKAWGLYAAGNCKNATIANSIFSTNQDGMQILGASNIAITAITVADNERFGLYVNGGAGVTVAGSTFSGNNTGIMLANAQGLAIKAGNTIQGNLIGLSAFGNSAGTTVVGTAIKNNTGKGVYLTGATNLKINGLNKIQGNGDGVYATGTCTGTLVNGNLIGGNKDAGLWLQDAVSFQAKNNTVTNNQTVGLRATGNATGTNVTGNTITNNKTNIVVTATGGTFQKA